MVGDKASPICQEWGIVSFPKFLLFSPKYEWNEEYDKGRLKELGKEKDQLGDDIAEWVKTQARCFVVVVASCVPSLPSPVPCNQ